MMRYTKFSLIYGFLFLLLVATILVGCQIEEPFDLNTNSKYFTLTVVSEDMSFQNMNTRSSNITKTNEEKQIRWLHLFFFDEEGNFLQPAEGKELFFQPYNALAENVTTISVDPEAFGTSGDTYTKAQTAKIYAVANVEPGTLSDADGNCKINNLNELKALVYRPTKEANRALTDLPEEGMPMFGFFADGDGSETTVDLTSDGAKSATIELKAMMARVDITISLNSSKADDSGTYPRLVVNKWKLTNRPLTTPIFSAASKGSTTNFSSDTKQDVVEVTQTYSIDNSANNNTFTISFYMFENCQQAQSFTYPTGTDALDYQKFKPQLAHTNASAFIFEGIYTTYNYASYEAGFKFYLGSNNINNFEVLRNHHYGNKITITGLTNHSGIHGGDNDDDIDPNRYGFDARVDVEPLGDNGYYLSILRERDHDAHFCVTPMDVYFYGRSQTHTVTITVPDDCDWIRLDKIPADNMEKGTAPDGCIETGSAWTAGNGKRNYFTTDLMTSLYESVTCEDNRDRVYLYVDENISIYDRETALKIEYYENGTKQSERILEIHQYGLVEVAVYDDASAMSGEPNHYIYIEQIEEYLDHYDPLDKYSTELIYPGLEWGLNDTSIADKILGSSSPDYSDAYYGGLFVTNRLISKSGHTKLDLNTKPRSAAEYCYNKNKRNSEGTISLNATGSVGNYNSYGGQGGPGWFLPAIRQLENMMTQGQNLFPEFRTEFYWSCNPGKKRVGFIREDYSYARATRYDYKNEVEGTDYIPSAESDTWTGPTGVKGKVPRTGINLRIRAAYMREGGARLTE